MIQIYKIYDNGGATLDRYTILTEPWHFGKSCEALTLSDDPTHPTYGISQWTEAFDGDHLGKEISIKDLPQNVQDHLLERLADEDEKCFICQQPQDADGRCSCVNNDAY